MKLLERREKVKTLKMIVVLILTGTLFLFNTSCSNNEEQIKISQPDNILINYSESNVKRIEKFVDRFNNGQADYLLIIPPIVDGGYWIYDAQTDGKQVIISIDSSRDNYSDGSISREICKGISIANETGEDGKTKKVLIANSCEGTKTIDKFKVLVLEDPSIL